MDCAECDEHHRELYGCGCSRGIPWSPDADGESFAGRARVCYERGADDDHWSRTCPRYCAMDPAVVEITADLRDYERAALGDVDTIEAALLEYLRVIESARAEWEAENMRQLSNG